MVVGNGGAGKSTFATELGHRSGLPVVHLDAMYWQPRWTEPRPEQWRAAQRAALDGPDWIADGNYGGTLDERLPRADVVVLLDYSRWRCLAGVLTRWWRWRGRDRPGMAPQCPERFDLPFLLYVARYPEMHRPRLLAAIAAHGCEQSLVLLRSRREARRWLAEADLS